MKKHIAAWFAALLLLGTASGFAADDCDMLVIPEAGPLVVVGDMNGDGALDNFDVMRMLRALVGIDLNFRPVSEQDVNDDGVFDVRDAALIYTSPKLRYVVQGPALRKPAIYLYPEAETEVSVVLGRSEALTAVYPAYDDGWRVTACPDGTLYGENGRAYYTLYYEADPPLPALDDESGFVIRGDEAAPFLEEKLALLGLSEREAEEMIIYWLPLLQAHDYLWIHFLSAEAIDEAMPLSIDPAPDTIIRVMMLWKGLDEPVSVPEQTLTPAQRTGFTAVEWGGIELTD